MRSPIVAMLWENWRLTRFEVGARMVLSLVLAAALLLAVGGADDADDPGGPIMVLFLGTFFHSCVWLSIAKLNGGKFMDGYRPGFPLHLLYSRPVRTSVIVGVTMGYSALMGAALFVAWAIPMRAFFDLPIPLAPIAAGVAALQLIQAACYWATRSRTFQWLGTMAAFWAYVVLAVRRAGTNVFEAEGFLPNQWSMIFDYSFVDYALIIAIVVICFAVTVAGVARQRHGDTRSAAPQAAATWSGSNWLGDRFGFACPTKSATWAQIWFELRSSGLTVIGTGLLIAIVIPGLFAAGARGEFFRSAAIGIPFMAVLGLLLLGGNAFGIRRKQGHAYASIFDATQASGTGSLAGIKVLTRSACVLAALGILAVSVALSSTRVSEWPDLPQVVELKEARQEIAGDFAALSVYELTALAIIVAGAITVLVAARALLEALFARYRKRFVVAVGVLLLFVLAMGLSALMEDGSRSEQLLILVLQTTVWILATALTLATVYLCWRVLAERLLTPLQAGFAVLLAGVFLAAWLTILDTAGVSIGELSIARTLAMLSPVLLVLLTSVAAPWSLSRLRHG